MNPASPVDSTQTLTDLLRWRATQQNDHSAYTFLADGEGQEVTLIYGDLDCRARAPSCSTSQGWTGGTLPGKTGHSMAQSDLWDAVPDVGSLRLPPTLSSGWSDAVHLWRINLELPAAALDGLAATLAPDELTRAERFYFPKDRAHYLAGRGLLRAILGRYLYFPPEQIRFEYQVHGKPALAADQRGDPPLEFNLSHSAGLALIATARGRRVGVDIEQQRGDRPWLRLAERFFSPVERAVLRALPAELQQAAFYACWTRKEAYIKARGEGLALSLERFDVMTGTSTTALLPPPHLRTPDEPAEAGRWSLHDVAVPAGYAAALAAEGGVGTLLRFDANRAFVH